MILGSFLFFTALVTKLTRWLARDDRATGEGYFPGGVLIAGSLLLTDLSTEQRVGLDGLANRDGLSNSAPATRTRGSSAKPPAPRWCGACCPARSPASLWR